MPSHFRIELENWLATLSVAADRVLDIGGAQKPVKGRLKEFSANEYKILDLENPHEGLGPDIVCDINLPISDNSVGPEGDQYLIGQFDTVFCLEVMEYIYDPMQAIKNIARMLRADGSLYISFPFIYPIHKPTGYDYLRYTKHGALKLLDQAGFDVLVYKERRPIDSEALMYFWKRESYKFDNSESVDALTATGCFIKANKI